MAPDKEVTNTSEVPYQDLNQCLDDVLPLLERDETVRLLHALELTFSREIEWAAGLDARRSALIRLIASAHDAVELLAIHSQLNELEMERFIQVESVSAVHSSCSEYRDLMIRKILDLIEAELLEEGATAPVPFALISMGSDGRGEQTLITDQDHLIVYGDGGGVEADDYFSHFSDLLVARLAEAGFKKCTGDIMPTNPTWRGSYSQWRKKLLAIVRYEYADYAKNLMDLIVLSDARYVTGDRPLADSLIDLIRSLEQDYFQVLWGMAKAATEMKVALGFMKRIWTEGSGEHKGEFNLKLLGWAPLVMNVRILAISQGVAVTNTVRRIELLEEEKSFSATTSNALIEAYHILTKHRILLQIKAIKGIQKDSYYLNPYSLSTDERERIRQALIRIEELQKMIHTNFSIM